MPFDMSEATSRRPKGPGRNDRKGISLYQAFERWSDEDRARAWLENVRWKRGVTCPHCGGSNAVRAKHPFASHRCKDCRKRFGVRANTPLAESRIPISKWIMAVYLDATNLKGLSSMKLYRDLGITQKSSWFLQHRIRETFMGDEPPPSFKHGKVFQIDETYIGGREGNKHSIDKIPGGQGGSTKQIVIGITAMGTGQLFADVLPDRRRETIVDLIHRVVPEGAVIYTDEARHYNGVQRERYAVNHSIGEYVKLVDGLHGMHMKVTTNHQESAWSMLSRSIVGIHHKMSPKHLRRYVKAFAGYSNIRHLDTEDQMKFVFRAMLNKHLDYDTLIEDNGLPSGSGTGGAYHPERRKRYAKI